MKNNILIAIGISVSMLSCQNNTETKEAEVANPSQPVAIAENVTQMEWLETDLDKGTIKEGEKMEVAYRFKNTGDKPLVIQDVAVSCGCTVADKPEAPIAPGAEGVIKAVFDSNNKPGPNKRSITVTANTVQKHHALHFSVNVDKK